MNPREILKLPLDSIRPNPNQPRRDFDETGLLELAESIRSYGVLQPVTVRFANGSYELVAGERRLRASRIAGIETIDAILSEMSDEDSAVLAIIENLQRQNLHFFEEAEGFQNLIGDYAFTQEALAAKVGKNQSTIANKLRLLRLPNKVQRLIADSDLSERHARALLKLDGEDLQLEVIEKVTQDGLTVRKTEELIDSMLNPQVPEKQAKQIPFKAYIRDIRILTNTIQENLEIVRRSGMDTNFDLQQTDNGYNIFISLSYGQNSAGTVVQTQAV